MEGFPFSYDFDVRYSDLDTFSHVNNVRYFEYMETARGRYLLQLAGGKGRDLPSIVVASARCDYRSPAYFGETIRVWVRVSRVGRSSFDLDYRMAERDSGRLVAEGATTIVFVDPAAGRSTPVPAGWRQALEAAAQDAR